MKKAIFAVSIVLLALLAVTCDLFEEGAEPASAEEGWVTLSIGTSGNGARAISTSLTQPAVTFLEVVFVRGSDIIRSTTAATAGVPTTNPWKVTIPVGNYSASGNHAVLFAGTTSKVLLGIGVISSGTNITSATTSITFTVTAVETAVATLQADSSFKITAPTSPGDYSRLATTTSTGHPSVPVFRVPQNSSAVKASWTFSNLNIGKASLGTTTGSVTSIQDGTSGVSLTISNISQPTISPTANSVAFTFDIQTPDSAGLTQLAIKVPVFAINASPATDYQDQGTDAATGWFLQGGSDNTTYDTGANNGGAILLDVGNVDFSVEVSVGSD